MAKDNDIYSVGEILAKQQSQTSTPSDSLKSAGGGLRSIVKTTTCDECGEPALRMPGQEGPVLCLDCHRSLVHANFKRGLLEERLRRAGLLSGEPEHMALDTFKRRRSYQSQAYQVVVAWLEDWNAHLLESPWTGFKDSVMLWSEKPGTGKTHMARAVQREVIIRGGSALFRRSSEVLDEIRASYNGDAEMSAFHIVQQMKESQLLILDDLGKEYVSERARPWFRNICFQVIDHRYDKGKPMIVTSNLAPDRLTPLLGNYASSRLLDMVADRVVDMTGPDWRMR